VDPSPREARARRLARRVSFALLCFVLF
jgi:hypothetical protein